MIVEAFFEVSALRAFQEALHRVEPTGPPVAQILYPENLGGIKRLGILAGSFNPPTSAHEALLAVARRELALDVAAFMLTRVIIDKDVEAGLHPVDRLLLLTHLARGHEGFGVAVASHGLYVDQAQAFRALLPGATLFFLVGFDKAVQIFDPRYYADRDATLHQLFSLASLAVAPRGPQGAEDLRRLLARPENAPYRSGVILLDVEPAFRHVSSTHVRERLARRQPVKGLVPPPVEAFLAAAGAYRPAVRLLSGEMLDAYALRARALTLLLSVPAEPPVDFPKLMRLAVQDSPTGRETRRLLSLPPGEGQQVIEALRHLTAPAGHGPEAEWATP